MGGLSIPAAVAALTAPGAPFEMDEKVIRGIATRIWKNAPPHLRAVFEASRNHGDLPFIVYEDERLTYAEHYRQCATLARALAGRFGVRKGDRVAIAMRNLPEWSVAFWAAAAIGAVAVPLNAWMTGPELEYCLADSGAAVLLADEERAERVLPHLAVLSLTATIVTRASKPLAAGFLPWSDVVAPAEGEATLPDASIDPEDDATIFYTSGTTGKPKGALGTHRNICTNLLSGAFAQARALLRRGEPLPDPAALPKKATLLSVPFFHVTGCHSVLATTLYGGNKLVLMYRFEPERAMQLIERERVTFCGGVPSIVWQILEHPTFGRYDLSSLELLAYGGAPSAPELVARIDKTFPSSQAGNGYGLTETSSITTQNLGDDYKRKPDSAGLVIPVCDVRVVDANGAVAPTGGVGELWIKGPNVVKGYWRKPEATAAAFTDGWLHSGDIVRIDEEGFVYVLDRAKDMLIRGGENIYCTEVEDALYSHPAVMDAAVVGIPHRVLGEEVGAIVQLTPGADVGEDELRRHVAQRLAGFKVPVRIELRHEPLPRNANGKILKAELRREMPQTRMNGARPSRQELHMRDFDEKNITDAVVERFNDTPDPRLREIMQSLVRHLHGFVRDVEPTFDEWLAAIGFLTRTGQMCTNKRQEFILLSDTLGVSMLVDAINHRMPEGATQTTVLGPFFVANQPELPLGADISGDVKGEPLLVEGAVSSADGKPLAGAVVDVWQSDADGFYDVQRPELDGHVLRGRLRTDAEGRFRLWSITPNFYPIPDDGPVGRMIYATKRHPYRPAHVHFMIAADGHETLVTHVFVAGDPYLDSDAVFGVKNSLIKELDEHAPGTAPDGRSLSTPWRSLRYDFGLKRAA